MKAVYCSIGINGTPEDLSRAEAIRLKVSDGNNLPVIPFLMFREAIATYGEKHDKAAELSVQLLNNCDEVWLFDKPEASVTVARDFELALKCGIPTVDMSRRLNDTDELGEILQFYQQKEGRFVPRVCFDEIAYYLKEGFDKELIKAAIEKGVRNNKNWSYINGILRNLMRDGIFTKAQLESRKGAKRNGSTETCATYDLTEYRKRLEMLPG